MAEQVHRIDYLSSQEDERLLDRTIDRILESGCEPSLIREVAGRLEWRPVFTAHPTEAARRSLLTKQKALSELLVERNDPRAGPAQHAAVDRRTAELIDQMWQTDELREVKPLPREEAGAVLYYLNDLFAEVLPDLGERIHHQFARLGIEREYQPADPVRHLGGRRPRRQSQHHSRDNHGRPRVAAPPGTAQPGGGGGGTSPPNSRSPA